MTDNPLLGHQLVNFRLERVLGRSGMAQVYYGWDVKLQRPVAVKVIVACDNRVVLTDFGLALDIHQGSGRSLWYGALHRPGTGSPLVRSNPAIRSVIAWHHVL